MGRMWRFLSILCFAADLTPSAAAQTFTTIDYPGANATQARAINARGDILGNWQDAAGNWHAYVLSGGTFSGFDCQGAVSTMMTSWNSKREAVGTLRDASGKWKGFYLPMGLSSSWEWDGAKCVIVEPKGSIGRSTNTGAFGISEAGDIIGEYDDSQGNFHGVLTRGGVHFIFDIVEGSWNGGFAFTPQGDILGHIQPAGDHMKGWMLTRSGLQIIEFPPGENNSMTCPFAVNAKGDIVGHYQRRGEAIHGYLLSKGTYTSFDVPDSTMTDARGISDEGVIVGVYTDRNSKTHGFVRQP